LTTLRSS